ncbi:hypothetical protein BC941DRAFT_117924 [Chlamydoabsidia padenii]|nr:hypothetical protein BC941DRAFT_117924 [Chlamydoabsidia padenii]
MKKHLLMKEWLQYKVNMNIWFLLLLFWNCQAKPISSDNLVTTPTASNSSASPFETENTVAYITLYPQRWSLIIGIVFASITFFFLAIAAALTIHMRRIKRKSKELKSVHYINSTFIRPQQPTDKSLTSLNHLFFRNKQLPPVIDPQLQNAIHKASMIPSL